MASNARNKETRHQQEPAQLDRFVRDMGKYLFQELYNAAPGEHHTSSCRQEMSHSAHTKTSLDTAASPQTPTALLTPSAAHSPPQL